MRLRAALVLAALALGAVACGGDDEEESSGPVAPRPELTVPGAETPTVEGDSPSERRSRRDRTDTTGTTDTTPSAPGADGTGGAQAPETPADTPENDTPPPQDSPAARFEKFCEENPGAC